MFLGGIDDSIREFTKLVFILLIIFLVVNNIPLFVDKVFLKQKGYASTAIWCGNKHYYYSNFS